MANRKTYTDEEKAAALALYREHGPAEASRRSGINASTISKWASRTGVATEKAEKTREAIAAASARNAELREDLKLEFRRKARALLDRMDVEYTEFVGKDGDRVHYPTPPAGAVRDYMIAAATAVDKAELLDGRATGRLDFRNQDQMDREIERLLDEAASSKNGHGTRQPAKR